VEKRSWEQEVRIEKEQSSYAVGKRQQEHWREKQGRIKIGGG
jgi:hypothetical protein